MKIHLTGIGGVGMAGLAVLLKRRGHAVSGCDIHPGARTRWLESRGIPVAIGHDAKHVEGQDLVVVTPAVAKDNPEYVAACAADLASRGGAEAQSGTGRCLRRGEVLAKLVSEASDSIAVCGSHGKTTTATFIAKLLLALGESVEWAIGGETGSFPVAGCAGSPSCACPHAQQGESDGAGAPEGRRTTVLVVEADESDGTLAEYAAKTLVVTNCEYDHPDHFKSRADYIACYDAARAKARKVIEGAATNAETAVRVARARGHSAEAIAAVLPQVTAELPDRRFQRVWPMDETSSLPSSVSRPQPLVYTDYGHHPTEIRYAITQARTLTKGTVRVLFQPHRYSRTVAFKKEFAAALAGADEVVVCPIYAAFEKEIEGGSSADLYAACRDWCISRKCTHGENECLPRIFLARSCAEAWEHARRSMKPGDLTLIQGAGDIISLVPQIQAEMGRRGCNSPNCTEGNEDPSSAHFGEMRPREKRRIWIGAGSNTWKSDLNLAVEYVKTTGPAGRPGATLLADPAIGPRIPWMAGIPGTIGGWIKMNAGAFGHSISEVIESVKVDGKWIPAADCGFSYRHSDITGEIQDVKFVSDSEDGKRETRDASGRREMSETQAYLARRKKFPPGTKGSVFKNPPGDFAGRLLESVGAKELRVGGAYVWSEHANVIVAGPDATPSDVLALAQLMAARVRIRLGAALEPEVAGLTVGCDESLCQHTAKKICYN